MTKVRAEDVARFAKAPPRGLRAALVYGEDSSLVAEVRGRLIAALLGPDAAAEMRLAEAPASDLRADPAALDAALRARGFFPGPRAALVTDATDGLAPVIGAALAEAARADAVLIATAGDLKGKSPLRRLFEDASDAAALPCPIAPPDERALREMMVEAGAGEPDHGALAALEALGEGLDNGQLRQFAATLALYRRGLEGPLTADDVAALAPAGLSADVDRIVGAVAEGDAQGLRRAAARHAAQGGSPTTVAIAVGRHFRSLHALAASGDPDAAAQRIRPPLWGPRRDAMVRQARRWGVGRLERALTQIHALDGDLRGGADGPQAAMLERVLLRLALSLER